MVTMISLLLYLSTDPLSFLFSAGGWTVWSNRKYTRYLHTLTKGATQKLDMVTKAHQRVVSRNQHIRLSLQN